ncbi:FxsA family protein [Actinomadura sp. ATCC 31491]|uniref:FxsA family protein n=1 Tax=Actinomadura luzonensis TaxID=2805427 RepID=A0ABT0G402_9ACTN|nr:FxsA family protein [Actinomadura luzonensis]MCK2219320.1 FxsA family protein [Actinomadura luzonensis]
MRLLLFLAFLVVPVLEIWLLIQVGSVIGGPATVALLIADSLLGAWIVRREGRRAWRALQEALRAGRMPERELADGALVLVGGALLLTPGFFTDVFGFACLLPVTRPLMRRLGAWFFERRVKRMAAASPYAGLFPSRQDPAAPHGAGRVVTGEVIKEEERETR